MVEDLPSGGSMLPDGGSAGQAGVLLEGVGEEVGMGAERVDGVVGGDPAGGVGVDEVGLVDGEDEVAGVAATGCAYFPVVGGHAAFVVGLGEAEGDGVEDGLQGAEFFEDGVGLRHGEILVWLPA